MVDELFRGEEITTSRRQCAGNHSIGVSSALNRVLDSLSFRSGGVSFFHQKKKRMHVEMHSSSVIIFPFKPGLRKEGEDLNRIGSSMFGRDISQDEAVVESICHHRSEKFYARYLAPFLLIKVSDEHFLLHSE